MPSKPNRRARVPRAEVNRRYYARHAQPLRDRKRREYALDAEGRLLRSAAAFVREYVRRGVLQAPGGCARCDATASVAPFHPDPTSRYLFDWLCTACRDAVLADALTGATPEILVPWRWGERFSRHRPGRVAAVEIQRQPAGDKVLARARAERPQRLYTREQLAADAARRAEELELRLAQREDAFARIDALNARVDRALRNPTGR
jgi:hypothetical protein